MPVTAPPKAARTKSGPHAKERALLDSWRGNPALFIQQALLDPYNAATTQRVAMTTQQREATDSVRLLVEAKLAVHRGQATLAQQEIAGKIGVSIMAGKGIGKDAWLSWMILWFLSLFPYCKIPCTSVSADQLKIALWSELAKWLQHSLVKSWLKLQTDKVFFLELEPEVIGKRWFAYAKTANPNSTDLEPEGLAGAHEDYLMVAVDEASGINDAIMHTLEGTLTQMCNFIVMIFNPTRSKGYAVDSHEKYPHRWITHTWNAEESEIGNHALHARLLEDHGRDSNPYRIRVLGLPPKTDDQTLIPWDWIEEAAVRELSGFDHLPLVKGVDCGAGGDKSIIATRRGYQVYPLKRLTTGDSTVLINWVGNDMDAEQPDTVYVDTIGIGWAVEGGLREKKGALVEPADARRTADNADKYWNKRAEMYDRLRDAFEKGLIAIPDDRDLKDQLGTIRCEYVGSKMKIVEKKKLKKLIGHSPDEADALALTFYRAPELLSKTTRTRPMSSRPHTAGTEAWLSA